MSGTDSLALLARHDFDVAASVVVRGASAIAADGALTLGAATRVDTALTARADDAGRLDVDAAIARATVDAMVHQTRDVVDAMTAASGAELQSLRVDGGASVMQLLLQLQADQLGVDTQCVHVLEPGLGVGVLGGDEPVELLIELFGDRRGNQSPPRGRFARGHFSDVQLLR